MMFALTETTSIHRRPMGQHVTAEAAQNEKLTEMVLAAHDEQT